MIKTYLRLISQCQSINQVNRLHIALENRMTPIQWGAIADEVRVNPDSRWGEAQHQWVATLDHLLGRSSNLDRQAYKRSKLARNVTLYEGGGEEPRSLLLAFTGKARRLMMPLPVFLQHLDASKTDVVLVNYPSQTAGFRSGLPGVARRFEDVPQGLAAVIPQRAYTQRLAFGVSGGALPAIFAATALGFDQTLTIGTGSPDEKRWHEYAGRSFRELFEELSRDKNGKTNLVYGADSLIDAEAALQLSKLVPNTKVIKVSDSNRPVGHVAVLPLLMAGTFREFLNDALFTKDRLTGNQHFRGRSADAPIMGG